MRKNVRDPIGGQSLDWPVAVALPRVITITLAGVQLFPSSCKLVRSTHFSRLDGSDVALLFLINVVMRSDKRFDFNRWGV